MVSLRAEARATAVKAKNADLAALAKLQAERDRIAELIAAQAMQGSGTYVGPDGGNGYLSMPVDGTSPRRTAGAPTRSGATASLHDGIDFGAACGTADPRRGAGQGPSTYYQSAWGNRVIVDHGVKHGVSVATISNHLSSYAVSAGRPRQARRRHRLRRLDRLVDRVPPALDGAPGRRGRGPDDLALTVPNPVAAPERILVMAKETGRKLIAQNKKARHDYHIDDTYEAASSSRAPR